MSKVVERKAAHSKSRLYSRVLAAIMTAAMVVVMVTGCKNGDSGESFSNGTQNGASEIEQDIVLTLATFNAENINDAVLQFNRTNPNCRIQVTDYSEFNNGNDMSAGFTRLTTEIIAGRAHDILDIPNMYYKEYAASGLFADLYPFLDSDSELNRNDFVDGVFQAAETNGCLYQVFPSFSIRTIVGHPSVVGRDMYWNMDEFRAVLSAYPNADMPLGMWLTKTSFLQAAVSSSIDEYISWDAGTVHFDTDNFIQLLEYAKTFPDVVNWGSEGLIYVPPQEAIATGRQLMHVTELDSFFTFHKYKGYFGGEVVCKAFPTESRRSYSINVDFDFSLAITETSNNKEVAWTFVRTILDKDWQQSNIHFRFPTNLAAFNQRAMGERWSDDEPDLVTPQEDVAQIMALISSATGTSGWSVDETIWNIIIMSAEDYFNGRSTAQDAAGVIQSRVSILVSERS